MQITEEINVAGRRVKVKELTLGEIRAWLGSRETEKEPDLIGAMLLEDVHVADLAQFCDLPPDQFDALTQSELIALRDLAKRLNPSFFGLLARMESLAKKMHSPTLSGTSAP